MNDTLPDQLELLINGSFDVGLQLEWRDGWLLFSLPGRGQPESLFLGDRYSVGRGRVQPTEEEWRRFWKRLEPLDVWIWEGNDSPDILDGVRWTLKLAHRGRRVRIESSHAYPAADGSLADAPAPEFVDFLRAVRDLFSQGEAH